MIGVPHIITDTDVQGGMEALALSLLGDASLWPQLVSLNSLVPPYLTLDPVASLGLPQDTETLGGAVSSGASSFALSGPLQLWQPGDQAALAATSASGIVSEVHTIQFYDGTTVTLTSTLQNGYAKGTTALSYPPCPIEPTHVLMPGQALYLPVTGQGASFVLSRGGIATDVFGSDAQAPLSFADGDIAGVSGPAVLAQRLRAALLTDAQSLPQAPTFGSRLHQVVGLSAGPSEYTAWIRDCLMVLPEVADVQSVALTRSGDQLLLSAKVYVHTSKTPLVLLNEALTVPVYS